MIQASVILDSIGPTAYHSRLHTQLWRYPKFIHQESLRHRRLIFTDWQEQDFSFSVSSARAIPFSKMLEEVRSDELRASPEFWGAEQKGMSPGEELNNTEKNIEWSIILLQLGLERGRTCPLEYITKLECAKRLWALDANFGASVAGIMTDITGVHKSIANRRVESDIHVNCLTTGTYDAWMNFFGLRLDSAADPTLRALAESSWKGWSESNPQMLRPRAEWHLPFIELQDETEVPKHEKAINTTNALIKISVARCARLSYLSFETGKRSTIEEDLKLYDRLVGSIPIHASPAEHQATPDEFDPIFEARNGLGIWLHLEQGGNLGPGWRQFRKMLNNEAVASLPEGYKL